jgi:hypothetical protein
MISPFAVARKSAAGEAATPDSGPPEAGDPKMEAALAAMEGEFSSVDENDPRAMGRMMRRMAEMTGEKIGGDLEEVVRKLEEGADPESLEEQLGADADPAGAGAEDPDHADARPEARHRFRARRRPPSRDPRLHDYA